MRNPLTSSWRALTAALLIGTTAMACGGDDGGTTTVAHGVEVQDAGAEEGRMRLWVPQVGNAAAITTTLDTAFVIALPGSEEQTGSLALTVTSDTAVTAVADDGGFTTNETVRSIEITDQAIDGVSDIDELDDQYAALEGVVFEHTYDANGFAGASRVLDESSLSPEASDAAAEIGESASTASVLFPTEPIGVGARWTAGQTISSQGFEITVTYHYELTALEGDRYEVSVTYDDDIDQEVTTDGTTFDVTGTISGGGTSTGSVSNYLAQSTSVEQQLDLFLEDDGETAEFNVHYEVEITGV